MADQLTVTGGDGNAAAPTNTGNPQQSAAAPATHAANAGSVQPGTAASALTSQSGIALLPPSLPSISLANTGLQTATPTSTSSPTKHHFNPLLAGLVIICVIIAIGMFWATSRSVKSTTY